MVFGSLSSLGGLPDLLLFILVDGGENKLNSVCMPGDLPLLLCAIADSNS